MPHTSVITDSQPAKTPLHYMRQLDGLRALAVLAVLFTHYLPERHWPFGVYWGGLGVRLFFVLSGFLITGILLQCRPSANKHPAPRVHSLRQFYVRRFLRIFLLYYAVLALAVIARIPPVRETLMWHVLYLSNFYFAHIGDYAGCVSHLWSLAVEEQFYLFWPWFILFLPSRALLPVLVAFPLIGPLFRLLGLTCGLSRMTVWVLTPGFFDTLGVGALLAYLCSEQHKLSFRWTVFLKRAALLSFPIRCGLEFLTQRDNQLLVINVFNDFFSAIIFAWIIFRAGTGFAGPIGAFLGSRPLVYVGRISYGIYLLHLFTPPLLEKIFRHLGWPAVLPLSVSAPLYTTTTILLAALSWRFFEDPINRLKRFFPYSRSGLKHGSVPTAARNIPPVPV